MENPVLTAKDPGAYSISSDIRRGQTDYLNDHIWELQLGGGEPPALAIKTTFGLRARNFRIFPRFVEGDKAITNPDHYEKSPSVQKYYPNYLKISFSPLIGIDVISEYWVPSSNMISGRIRVTNSRLTQKKISLQLTSVLSPTAGGNRMATNESKSFKILQGHTHNIYPVIHLAGNPEFSDGPYPALVMNLELVPGGSRQINWGHAALDNPEKSLDLIQKMLSLDWDGEIARLEVINERLPEIETGDPDWNAAFKLSQINALRLLIGGTKHLPYPSFVSSRQPDQGYSPKGDGSDYGHQWEGQTPLEADYLASILLPAEPDLMTGIVDNFLTTKTNSGFIDSKPGLAGQRGRVMATPVLTNLVWRIYQATEDISYLERYFSELLSFVQAWFRDQQDRDGDGLPEWANTQQSGFEDHPLFSHWRPWSQGGDISKIESPSLCAFLYNEIQLLIKMARIIDQTKPITALEAIADNLKIAVENSWDSSKLIYKNWDRESHFSPVGENLGNLQGPGEIKINRKFDKAVRISIQVDLLNNQLKDINVFIHGIGTTGNQIVERINSEQFQWHLELGKGIVNSEKIYGSIEYVEINKVSEKDKAFINVMEISGVDQTLLLPLWAKIPDEVTAKELIMETIRNPDRFWKPYGIPACIQDVDLVDHPCFSVHMIWNNLIGEGLLKYGYQEYAAELLEKLMGAIVHNLKSQKTFYHFYNIISGQGRGDRNALGGFAPISLFMKTLGVWIISPTKVILKGKNPFPWPVKIRYRGLTIIREKTNTKITFPGGQSAIVKSTDPRIVTLDEIHQNII